MTGFPAQAVLYPPGETGTPERASDPRIFHVVA